MRKTSSSVLAAAGLLAVLSGDGVFAHHALESMYDTSSDVVAVATLARVDWINPHAWMRFNITYPTGAVVQNVLIETLGLGSLRAQGIGRETLEVGKQYTITFYPARNGQPGGFMTKLVGDSGGPVGPPGIDPEGDGAPATEDDPSAADLPG